MKVGVVGDFAPGTVTGVDVDGVKVVMVNVGGKLYALSNSCPHVGLPMTAGYVHNDTIVCPFHGSMFKVETGAQVSGPASDDLETYTVRIEGEDVLVGKEPG